MSVTNTLEGAASMSIYTLLKGEHREVSALFKALEVSPNALEKPLFDKLRRELISHSNAEKAVVYPELDAKSSNKELIQEAEEEHTEIENLLMTVENAEGDGWKQPLRDLKNKVENHVKEEEKTMFDEMKSVLSDEEAKNMAKDFSKVKKQSMEMLK